MDYEKKYKEALEKARKLYNEAKANDYMSDMEDYEIIFPELKESDGEKIRKDCIKYLDWEYQHCPSNEDKIQIEKCIAWLEKQGKIDKESYEISEKEKCEFVGDGFIKCYADFQDFKEGETYWLEYVGNDNFNVRSDNLLGKTYHITPCQLYTIFKKMTWLEKHGWELVEQKPAWSEDYEMMLENIIKHFIGQLDGSQSTSPVFKDFSKKLDWLRALRNRYIWKPTKKQLKALDEVIRNRDLTPAEYKGLLSLWKEIKEFRKE